MRDIVAGAALGALVGLLVGLATASVVGAVVGALVAVLAAFFGLKGEGGLLPAAAPLRVLGFSAAAVVTLLLGLWLRAGDVLAPDPAARSAVWQAAGFDAASAAELVAIERLGVVRGGWQMPGDAVAAARERGTRTSTALFSGDGADSCAVLRGRDYPSAEAWHYAFRAEGGGWRRFSDALPSGLADADRIAAYKAALTLVCGGEGGR